MISEQIIEDYLEHKSNLSEMIQKLKITLLLISIIGLIFFSL
ncbi:MAG: hypothetical protein WD361_12415 [Gracilimonas sp.]